MDLYTDLDFCSFDIILKSSSLSSYQKSDPVYHYTSSQGLLGILQDEGLKLWFSQYDSLNDTSEGIHAVEVYRDVCRQLLAEKKISDSFYQEIYDVNPSSHEVFIHVDQDLVSSDKPINLANYCFTRMEQKYICCFSKDPDSLPMWNYYSKNGRYEGYNIEVSFESILHGELSNSNRNGYLFNLFTVIYDNQEKKHIIQDAIERLYSYFKTQHDEIVIAKIKRTLAEFLKHLSLKFKNSCFIHENEVRAILTLPQDNNPFPIKYREKAGYNIPYIEFKLPQKIISGITVGPLINGAMATENIKKLIKDRGYSICSDNIRPSSIPIRY